MKMETRECSLEDLPMEILDDILSYVTDVDLISVHKVGSRLQESANRLINRHKKLEFTGCYHFKDEDMLTLAKSYAIKEKLRHLNLNHCYWLKTSTLMSVIDQLDHLQECHLIECSMSPEMIETILRKNLTSLSISWGDEWDKTLRFVLRRDRRIKSETCPPVFRLLKHLVIFVPRCVGPSFLIDISQSILEHCSELETFKLYDSHLEFLKPRDHRREQRLHPRFCLGQFQLRLPKLHSLTIDIFDEPQQGTCLTEFLLRLFRQRKTSLKEVYLGRASFSMLDRENAWANAIVPWISTDEINTICLDDHPNFAWFNSQRMFPVVEPFVWERRKTPNCRAISINHTRLHSTNKIFETITAKCLKLEKLSMHGCQIEMDNLLLGMSAIATYSQLTFLSLTVDTGEIHFEGPIRCLLNILEEFIALRTLHLTTQLLSCSKNYQGYESDTERHSLALTTDTEANEMLMEINPFYKLTQRCKEIEEFKILSPEMENDRVVSEVLLACISKWKNLKTLHLVNIPTAGEAQFLPIITRNCNKLKALYMKNVCCADGGNYTPSLIESLAHAHALKDLSIVQDLQFSLELCSSLEKCDNLERIFLQSLEVPIQLANHFVRLLGKITSLIAIIIEVSWETEMMANEIRSEMECLRIVRPALFYILDNDICSEEISWPVIHHELQRYIRTH